MKWLAKILVFFDEHPWDWVAHILLGFLMFVVNLSALRVIDELFLPMAIKTIYRVACFGTINFVIAIELVQWDIFGISWRMILDSVIDLAADLVGIGLAIGLFLKIAF